MANSATRPVTSRAKRVELILSQLETLPTLPAVAVRLIQLTTDKRANAKQIVSLIESDPSLTAKILKLARRADAGISPQAAKTVERAVVMLGLETVRNTILSIKVFEVFGPDDRDRSRQAGQFNRYEFWKHSIAVGCAARLIAKELPGNRADPEEAFVCGLLHDLGKIALDAILPKSYSRVVDLARIERIAISDAESRLLGVDHTVVGRRLGQRWGLPEMIVNAMWLHHNDPDSLPANLAGADYVRIAHLADLLVREHRIGFSGNYAFARTSRDLAHSMHLSDAAYDRIVRKLGEDIEQRAELLGLADINRHDIYINALSTANEELGRLNADLADTNRKLRRRSRYFEALVQLADGLGESADLAATCQVAAASLRNALQAEAAAIIVGCQDDGFCVIGYATGDIVASQWREVESDIFQPAETPQQVGGFCPKKVALDDPVAQICDPYLPPGELWISPIRVNNGWSAWAAVVAGHETVRTWQTDSAEIASIVNAVSLAIRQTIASQKAAELAETLAEQARQLHEAQARRVREKSLDVVAEMAAGAGHEMNNPLAIISGRAQLLLSRATDEETRNALETIVQQAKRCSEIVSELMQFARPEPPHPINIDLQDFLGRLLRNWAERRGLKGDQISLEIPPDIPQATFDPQHLECILLEILENSAQAVEEDLASLRVNCRAEASDETIVLSVADNGPGMTPETLAKALLPFFSHREAGRRRGLGLARAYRLAELNGGDLWLDSEPGKGTTAYIRMPAAKD